MAWYNPFSWGSSTPDTSAPLPPAAPTVPFGARRRTLRGGRKGSKRTRTGKRSNRA